MLAKRAKFSQQISVSYFGLSKGSPLGVLLPKNSVFSCGTEIASSPSNVQESTVDCTVDPSTVQYSTPIWGVFDARLTEK